MCLIFIFLFFKLGGGEGTQGARKNKATTLDDAQIGTEVFQGSTLSVELSEIYICYFGLAFFFFFPMAVTYQSE